jgi:hypothetical protein
MKIATPETSYNWFVDAYKAAGYKSLNQFANAKGYQKSSLSRYFHLERHIPSNTLGALAKDLKTTPEEILKKIGAY